MNVIWKQEAWHNGRCWKFGGYCGDVRVAGIVWLKGRGFVARVGNVNLPETRKLAPAQRKAEQRVYETPKAVVALMQALLGFSEAHWAWKEQRRAESAAAIEDFKKKFPKGLKLTARLSS